MKLPKEEILMKLLDVYSQKRPIAELTGKYDLINNSKEKCHYI